MRVLITGAHFTPAQAVISELKNYPDIDITYIGRKTTIEGDKAQSVESKVLPELGVKFRSLIAGRLQRNFTRYTIPSLIKIPIGFIQAFIYLLIEKPDVVLSFGGYVAVPTVICAWLLSIPVIVHEQTLVIGLANRVSNIFASTIAVSYLKHFEEKNPKIILTGNPLRKELLLNPSADEKIKSFVEKSEREKLPLILITGGNQGSHIINENISQILDKLTEKFFVIHQVGDSKFRDFENLEEKQKSLLNQNRYLVKKWINTFDWGYLLRKIDLCISRAGANTLYELAYFGVPSIVIPLPYLYKNEQQKNAEYYKSLGLVDILNQNNLNPEKLLQKINDGIKNLDELKERAKEAKKVVISDAAKKLAQEVILRGELNVREKKV